MIGTISTNFFIKINFTNEEIKAHLVQEKIPDRFSLLNCIIRRCNACFTLDDKSMGLAICYNFFKNAYNYIICSLEEKNW